MMKNKSETKRVNGVNGVSWESGVNGESGVNEKCELVNGVSGVRS
jgi:hypothetical protein